MTESDKNHYFKCKCKGNHYFRHSLLSNLIKIITLNTHTNEIITSNAGYDLI